MTDNETNPELPRSVLEEIKDLLQEVHEDYSRTILDTDQELFAFMRKLSLDMLISGHEPSLMVDDIATALVWMLMIGREHQARGFGSPLPREDSEGLDLISDESIINLIEGRLE